MRSILTRGAVRPRRAAPSLLQPLDGDARAWATTHTTREFAHAGTMQKGAHGWLKVQREFFNGLIDALGSPLRRLHGLRVKVIRLRGTGCRRRGGPRRRCPRRPHRGRRPRFRRSRRPCPCTCTCAAASTTARRDPPSGRSKGVQPLASSSRRPPLVRRTHIHVGPTKVRRNRTCRYEGAESHLGFRGGASSLRTAL